MKSEKEKVKENKHNKTCKYNGYTIFKDCYKILWFDWYKLTNLQYKKQTYIQLMLSQHIVFMYI